jgi:hypothetical protein
MELTGRKRACELLGIDPVGLGLMLFVRGRHIGRVHHQTVDPLCAQRTMGPEAGKAGLVNTMVHGTREIAMEVMDERLGLRRLREGPVRLIGAHQDADLPALLGDIQANENVLTGEVEFPTFVLQHREPLFGCVYWWLAPQYTH